MGHITQSKMLIPKSLRSTIRKHGNEIGKSMRMPGGVDFLLSFDDHCCDKSHGSATVHNLFRHDTDMMQLPSAVQALTRADQNRLTPLTNRISGISCPMAQTYYVHKHHQTNRAHPHPNSLAAQAATRRSSTPSCCPEAAPVIRNSTPCTHWPNG